MNTRRWGCIHLFCFWLFCFSLSSGFAQQNGPAGQVEPPATPAGANRRIALDVVVTDKSGKPVSGLQQQDFKLLDNKQPAKILAFDAVQGGGATASPPVEVVLIVDEVNTAFTRVSFERDEVTKFLQRNGGMLQYPTSLAFLTDTGAEIGKTASRDGNTLIAEMNQNKAGLRSITRSQGIYGAGDRVQLSLQALEQLAGYEATQPGRKLAVWISPGWPLLTGPRIDLSSKDEQGLFGTVVGLSDALRLARITLYSVDPLGTADAGGFRTFYYETFLKGLKKADQVQIGNLGLQVLAVQSGGQVLNSNNDLLGEIVKCVADANAYYVLTFDGLRGDGPNEYHALEVKLDKPGLKARTRTGYYAQP
jgi:VWFA-related protein